MAPMTPTQWTLVEGNYQRFFGDSEFAFYPASQNGLGDMFLHLAFHAPKDVMRPSRIAIAWATIRSRHPLLMCKVKRENGDINAPYFFFSPPSTLEEALKEAEAAMHFKNESKDELIFNYMNGPRSLSDDYLSYLLISNGSKTGKEEEYDLLMCAPHFTGDGTSLHQSTHELLSLLASSLSDEELAQQLHPFPNWAESLPPACESRMSVPQNAFARAASKINFVKTLQKEIGGHTFARVQRAPQRTIMLERAFTEEQTTAVLAQCKSNGVTVNHALSVLCNVAWARCIKDPHLHQLPLMMYTAINLRPRLSSHPSSTYWFLALTYFNIVLPAFLPASPEVFWHRAKIAKSQTRHAVQSPFLSSRALEMANIRANRARGIAVASAPTLDILMPPSSLPPAPSAALLGLSMIGNLDSTYTRSSYPSFHLHTVTTASRQKAGGLLLLEHTFDKKLWLHLCWDEYGFEQGQVERFWEGLQSAVHDFLIRQ